MINYSQYLGPPKVLLLSGVMYYNQHNCIKHISCVNKCETLQKINYELRLNNKV